MNQQVLALPDSAAVAQLTAAKLLVTIIDTQCEHTPVHICLTGGGLGTAVLAEVATNPLAALVDWDGVHLWWSDERFLPQADPQRNETGARTALLTSLEGRLADQNIHPIPGPSTHTPDSAAAARQYASALAAQALPGELCPRFDVLLLGVGPDGHIASLFPDHNPETHDDDTHAVICVTDAPKPPPERVSLTLGAINLAQEIWLIAAGSAKADAIATALTASTNLLPAAKVHGRNRTLWIVDAAALAAADTPTS